MSECWACRDAAVRVGIEPDEGMRRSGEVGFERARCVIKMIKVTVREEAEYLEPGRGGAR